MRDEGEGHHGEGEVCVKRLAVSRYRHTWSV